MSQVGTDIQDNKCSWLVVQALQRATADQRALLEEHYGKHDPQSVSSVDAHVRRISNDVCCIQKLSIDQ
jgi:farnesyl diphosphate synthase